ncbi:class I SAM-dependent methyltransferase [Flavobacteriaceae bacterium S356]|uniref:Class I SAM-dependent methyltransferase n=1 Tax=Asprobacillus argus TaxID=3076534 RepID=A0ABU3LIE0_9FLAO|nr:class I SAM-dependent methyltransferase [Flavobacteriaceae bacterium S356]
MERLNTSILQKEVQQFIAKNLTSDITKLILKGSPFTDISVQELANQIVARQKSRKKLPTWFNSDMIYYPNKLSIEQSSSEITAAYKSKLVSGNSLIDITGGFGIDAFYFSKEFKNVTHCEVNTELSEIVSYNNKQLGISNIETISGDGIKFIQHSKKKFDSIYVDPSRRDDVKGKVFLLGDCQPNIPENLELLFERSNTILIKNSPILDITSTIKELAFVKEIHIVAINNDVKELLFLLEKGYQSTIMIHTVNFSKNQIQKFSFPHTSKEKAHYAAPKKYIYEPNAAVLKSGGFNEIAVQLKLDKIHRHSHLYTSDVLVEDFPGRIFNVTEVLPYDKKLKRKLVFNKANITTRNFPKSVAHIRKELKLKDGGENYLFFSTDIHDNLIVLNCVKNVLKHS